LAEGQAHVREELSEQGTRDEDLVSGAPHNKSSTSEAQTSEIHPVFFFSFFFFKSYVHCFYGTRNNMHL